jgi:hypothetical protein
MNVFNDGSGLSTKDIVNSPKSQGAVTDVLAEIDRKIKDRKQRLEYILKNSDNVRRKVRVSVVSSFG